MNHPKLTIVIVRLTEGYTLTTHRDNLLMSGFDNSLNFKKAIAEDNQHSVVTSALDSINSFLKLTGAGKRGQEGTGFQGEKNGKD